MYYGLSLLLLLDCIIPFVLAYFYEGYSHQTMLLSVLGNESSPVHKIYCLWMGILGVGIVWPMIVQACNLKKSLGRYMSLF
ncbi:MAG: hypothetical protein J6F30_09340 [Cellulosilyticum sp.]|nr:hypothetical protein [Cellulosilyticum sp.]